MQICNTLARAMRRFFLLAQSRNFRESTRHKRPPHFVLSPSSDRRTRGAIDSVLGAIGRLRLLAELDQRIGPTKPERNSRTMRVFRRLPISRSGGIHQRQQQQDRPHVSA
jgi:hypothetical protein